jgi:curved DNA-binding protein CbpA
MLTGAWEKVNQMLCGKTVYEFELEKARAIFMLPKDYTSEDLKKARRLMMKVYHPDKAGVDVTREAQIINDAHDLLKADLERRGQDIDIEEL